MNATSYSFSYIRTDSKGKPYTIRVFVSKSQLIEIAGGILVTVQEVDEETGFQKIDNYYIRKFDSEYLIGNIKNQRFNTIKSDVMDELK